MTDSADDILRSLKNDLNDNRPANHRGQANHEAQPSTVTFVTAEGEDAFPYAYVRHIKRRKDRLIVQTADARIVINGQHLETLFSQLRRFRSAVIAATPKADRENGEAVIESITITYEEE